MLTGSIVLVLMSLAVSRRREGAGG
jgi:hypothetical protein